MKSTPSVHHQHKLLKWLQSALALLIVLLGVSLFIVVGILAIPQHVILHERRGQLARAFSVIFGLLLTIYGSIQLYTILHPDTAAGAQDQHRYEETYEDMEPQLQRAMV